MSGNIPTGFRGRLPWGCVWLVAAAAGLVAEGIAAAPATRAPSVMVCGGTMMNGNKFADSVKPALREHFAGCRLVALVLHASHPEDRARMEARLQQAFTDLNGAPAESLHRYDVAGQRALLARAEGIFVGGGETFVLLRELGRTGQLALIRERVAAGVPYLGTSAGANVAGERIGTTNDFPVADVPSRDALGLVPATINPHHPAPQETAEFKSRTEKIQGYLRFNPDETVLGLGNAALVRLHAGRATVATGQVWIYRAGGGRALAPGDEVPELLVSRSR